MCLSTSLWFPVFFFFFSPGHWLWSRTTKLWLAAAASAASFPRAARRIHDPAPATNARINEDPGACQSLKFCGHCGENSQSVASERHWSTPWNVGLHFAWQIWPEHSCHCALAADWHQAKLQNGWLDGRVLRRVGSKVFERCRLCSLWLVDRGFTGWCGRHQPVRHQINQSWLVDRCRIMKSNPRGV